MLATFLFASPDNILAGGLGKLNGQYLLRYNSMLFFWPYLYISGPLDLSHSRSSALRILRSAGC